MSLYYNMRAEDIARELNTSLQYGLSSEEVIKRLAKYGPNVLAEEKKVPPIVKFFQQFNNFLVYLLIVAAVVSFIFGDMVEGAIILVIIILNAILGWKECF